MLACTAVVAVASSALAQDVGLLRSALEEVASIAGEPSVVSAGGITRDQTPLLTLENPTPFSEDAARRRLAQHLPQERSGHPEWREHVHRLRVIKA